MFTGREEIFEGFGEQVNTISANTTPTDDSTLVLQFLALKHDRCIGNFHFFPLLHPRVWRETCLG